jgi:hypothetical protein
MKKTLKIINTFLVFVLLLSLTTFPAQAKPVSNPIFTDTEITQLVPYMSISEDGFFVLDQESISDSVNVSQKTIEWVQNEFSEINAHLKEIPLEERPTVIKDDQEETQLQDSESGVTQNVIEGCVFVDRWILDTIAWTAIVVGTGYVTLGLFAGGTIYGIPIGAILQAEGLWIGVSGTYMLWYTATYYPNGVTVCW